MMEDWKELKIKDFCEFKYGKNLPENKRIPGQYPVYGSSNLAGTHNEFLVEGPGIIIGRKGTVGRVQFSKDNFFPIDTTYYVAEDKSQVDLKFLYYRLPLCGFEEMNSDAAVPGLNRSAAISQKINLPTLPTQRKIAAILSAYDDLIENNLKRIKLLEEKAQLTYEEWFARMKFPGHETTAINKETDLPEGWEKMPLGEFTNVLKGKNITKSTIREGNVPVVAGGLSPAYYHDTPNTKNPVITVSASGANAGFTNMYLEDVWASDCSYIDSTMCDYLFFVYALMIHNQPKIYHFQKGAAQPHVYPKDLVRLEAVIPTKDLLTKFNKISMDIFDSIRLLTKQNQNLKEARDILLPRLMTGMIDVKQMNLENLQPTTA